MTPNRPRVLAGTWGDRVSLDPDVVIIDFRARRISRGGIPVKFRCAATFMVAALLVSAHDSGLVTKADLYEAMYGDREDGGPLDDKVIDVHICWARKSLAEIAVSIDTYWGRGLVVSIPALRVAEAAE